MTQPLEEGLRYVDLDSDADARAVDGQTESTARGATSDLETLRDELVDAFNARDLDAVLALVADDLECPDLGGEGAAAFAGALTDIWDRSPGAIITRAFLDDAPCAVAWMPDEEGCWSRAGLLVLDGDDDQIRLVELVDDADALDRATADDPTGEELEEGSDWGEWDSGEATEPGDRSRARP